MKKKISMFLLAVLAVSLLAVPVLAENNTSGLLKKGSSDKFYNGLDQETKDYLDWITGAVSYFFKIIAGIALLIAGIVAFAAWKKHNAHEESAGMAKIVEILGIVFLVSLALGFITQIFKY